MKGDYWMEKLALKKALFDELKQTNQKIEDIKCEPPSYKKLLMMESLKSHKDFIQRLIDICVDRNKF